MSKIKATTVAQSTVDLKVSVENVSYFYDLTQVWCLVLTFSGCPTDIITPNAEKSSYSNIRGKNVRILKIMAVLMATTCILLAVIPFAFNINSLLEGDFHESQS
jgi:hypothetical protein